MYMLNNIINILNEKFGDKLTVLRGIELGDGFLDHKVYEKAIALCEDFIRRNFEKV